MCILNLQNIIVSNIDSPKKDVKENTILASRIEEFSSKIKQIHFWYFWEKQVSLTEFIHMSMEKQNLDKKKNVFAWVIWI